MWGQRLLTNLQTSSGRGVVMRLGGNSCHTSLGSRGGEEALRGESRGEGRCEERLTEGEGAVHWLRGRKGRHGVLGGKLKERGKHSRTQSQE